MGGRGGGPLRSPLPPAPPPPPALVAASGGGGLDGGGAGARFGTGSVCERSAPALVPVPAPVPTVVGGVLKVCGEFVGDCEGGEFAVAERGETCGGGEVGITPPLPRRSISICGLFARDGSAGLGGAAGGPPLLLPLPLPALFSGGGFLVGRGGGADIAAYDVAPQHTTVRGKQPRITSHIEFGLFLGFARVIFRNFEKLPTRGCTRRDFFPQEMTDLEGSFVCMSDD